MAPRTPDRRPRQETAAVMPRSPFQPKCIACPRRGSCLPRRAAARGLPAAAHSGVRQPADRGHAPRRRRPAQATRPDNRDVRPKREHGPHRNVKTTERVELRGLEPLTPCLQTTGSTSTRVHPRRSPSSRVPAKPPASTPVAVLPCCTHTSLSVRAWLCLRPSC